jgi:dihydrofolate reductase
MRKLVVIESISLDGVMQAPGRPDEDVRGGFEHGGWALPYSDDVMGNEMAKGFGRTELLLGRRTYEDLYSFWPKQEANPFTEVLNNTQKYVASNSLKEPLPWMNSTLLAGDAVEAVAELKDHLGVDIGIIGSGSLVQALMAENLIDEYTLLIHPLVLGSGLRLFAEGVPPAKLRLANSVTTTTGVMIATYHPASA